MTVRLILARHGDTFGPHDKVVFVGARNDLPLVQHGLEQASELGKLLARSGIVPDLVFAGPLRRTQEYARAALKHLPKMLPVQSDLRLNELDYGKWAGLSNDEIKARFGPEELAAWSERGVWPRNAGWPGQESAVRAEVQQFINHVRTQLKAGTVLVVSSNGRLRYFLETETFEKFSAAGKLKIKTGNISVMELTPSQTAVVEWDVSPGSGLTLTAHR